MRLVGANPGAQARGLEELPGKSNYFIGNDPSKWRTNISNYARVELRDVYPGISLVFYGERANPEYDWVVAPGADPALIRVRFEGAAHMRFDHGGDLVLQTEAGELRQLKPSAYQPGGIGKRPVEAKYTLTRDGDTTLELGSYNRTQPLVIDPLLSYTALIGGSGGRGTQDEGLAIAADNAGSAYVAGLAISPDFPTVNALQGTKPARQQSLQSAFVLKINPAGTMLVFSTYLGSSGGEGFVGYEAVGIAVDSSGAAIVTGTTGGTTFRSSTRPSARSPETSTFL